MSDSKELKVPSSSNSPTASSEPARSQPTEPRVVIEFQGVSKEVMSQVWEQLKAGATPEGAAFTLARSMCDHQHWWAFYETIGIFDTGDEQYPGDVNPFLHVNLHFMIGLQILNASPKGAQQFYSRRVELGDDPHEVVHMMMEAFQRHLVWTAIHGDPGGQIDMNAYEATLAVLEELDIEELWEKLGHEQRPQLHPEAYEQQF